MSESPESADFEDDVANAESPESDDQSANPFGDDADSLREQLQDAEQQALRAHAELDNYRKRTQRTMEEDRKYAGLPVMRDLLPVLDNLSRALSAADKNSDEGIVQGVQMVVSQLEIVLEQHGCQKISAIGQAFDPSLHEAVGQHAHDEVPANHVCLELQNGYRLHDRVVRPAQVYISTGPAAPTEDN